MSNTKVAPKDASPVHEGLTRQAYTRDKVPIFEGGEIEGSLDSLIHKEVLKNQLSKRRITLLRP